MVLNTELKKIKTDEKLRMSYITEVEELKLSHNAKFMSFKHRSKIETLKYFIV